MGSLHFTYDETYEFLAELIRDGQMPAELRTESHSVVWRRPGSPMITELKLPLLYPQATLGEQLGAYFSRLSSSPPPHVLLLIRAGNASLGHWREQGLEAHKVIRKYMVRKKQGKAQITYLNRKGKSRLGSRIRLAQTFEFFEEINTYLEEWLQGRPEDRVFFSCPIRLWSMLFESKVSPPFSRHEARLQRIPLHVHTPSFRELERIHRLISMGLLVETES